VCDLNPDWVVQMIDCHMQTLERIEGLLEKLVKMEESKTRSMRIVYPEHHLYPPSEALRTIDDE
jgi:hypothetical protein